MRWIPPRAGATGWQAATPSAPRRWAPIHIYDTLQSSNLTAKQLALGGAPHGTLVLTAHQQAGRGRLGRRFESPAGKGVYLSLILRPTLSAADAQSATISAAVAVARAVKALCASNG